MAELKLGPPKIEHFRIRKGLDFLAYLNCGAGEKQADYLEHIRKVNQRYLN